MPHYFKSHLFLHVIFKKMKTYYIAPISTSPDGEFLAGLDLRQCNLLNQLGQRKYSAYFLHFYLMLLYNECKSFSDSFLVNNINNVKENNEVHY